MAIKSSCESLDLENINCKDCLCRSGIFNYLTKSELEKASENKFQVKYKAGEIIFKKGTRSTHSVSFTHGMAKVFDQGNRGEIIVRLIKPTEFISGYGLLFDKTHHYTVSAITDASACFIDVNLITEFFDNNSIFRSAFIAEVQGYNYFIQQRLIELLNKKNPGRIAGTLLYLSRDVYSSNEFRLTLKREELRDLCGVSSDSMSRILAQFQAGDLIEVEGKRLKILNSGMLQRIWLNG